MRLVSLMFGLLCVGAVHLPAASNPKAKQLIADGKTHLDHYRLPKAELALRKAIKTLNAEAGSPLQRVKSLMFLAATLREQCQFTNALETAALALRKTEAIRADRRALHQLDVYRELGLIEHERGNYATAIARFEEGLALEKQIGKTTGLAYGLTELASVQLEIGRFTAARQSLERALATVPHLPEGEREGLKAFVHNNLGLFHAAKGNYKTAELFYKKSLTWHAQNYGRNDIDTTVPRANLAALYRDMGSHRRAERMFELNLKVCLAKVGEQHVFTSLDMANLASLYHDTGRLEKAIKLYRKTLDITIGLLGADHPYAGVDHSNLALAYSDQGEFDLAENHLAQARRILQKHPEAARTMGVSALQNLAGIYADNGALADARRLFHQALEVELKTTGDTSADVSNILHHLALIEHRDEHPARARALARQKYEIEKTLIANVFSFTSEEERLAFVERISPLDPLISIGDPADLAPLILERKAMVLDSLLRDTATARAAPTPELRRLEIQLHKATHRWIHAQTELSLLIETPDALPARLTKAREKVNQLQRALEKLRRALARASHQPEAPGPLEPRVRAALPADAVLIEFIEFDQYETEGRPDPQRIRSLGALILPPKGPARWILIGRARAIEKLAAEYSPTRPGTDAAYEALLKTLGQRLFESLRKQLPAGTRTLVIAPDGVLNFLNFNTLLTAEGRFLCEEFEILHVSTGRDLARQAPAPKEKQPELIVLANPQFGRSAEGDRPAATPRPASVQSLSFQPLPGTTREAAFLQREAAGWKLKPRVLDGQQATEAALREMRGPFILHLATHGFFIGPDTGKQKKSSEEAMRKIRRDPRLMRSGLALAGAADTLRRWQEGAVPDGRNDGILTTAEVRLLALSGNWLTVLSACETGAGKVRAGEGVLGLRRAFARAGTQNLLYTLWPISDRVTTEIMEAFYRQALASQNAPRALAKVQRDWLVKLRQAEGLKPAVQLAGPFLLTFQGAVR